jgi:hypothetical protein
MMKNMLGMLNYVIYVIDHLLKQIIQLEITVIEQVSIEVRHIRSVI